MLTEREGQIIQISACVDRGSHYLYVLLKDGRVFRRQKPSMFGKKWSEDWEWVRVNTDGLWEDRSC